MVWGGCRGRRGNASGGSLKQRWIPKAEMDPWNDHKKALLSQGTELDYLFSSSISSSSHQVNSPSSNNSIASSSEYIECLSTLRLERERWALGLTGTPALLGAKQGAKRPWRSGGPHRYTGKSGVRGQVSGGVPGLEPAPFFVLFRCLAGSRGGVGSRSHAPQKKALAGARALWGYAGLAVITLC